MGDHIVKSFDEEMSGLSAELVRMGELVVDQIKSAMKALKSRDMQMAERVNKNDKQVDAINDDIEERVMSILALRHPYAVDLRETIGALKVARELERIGDLAKNCAMRTGVILEDDKIKGTKKILKMGKQVTANVETVMKAYKNKDEDLALEIWFGDEAIDNYCNAIFETVLTGMMADNSSINACTQMTFAWVIMRPTLHQQHTLLSPLSLFAKNVQKAIAPVQPVIFWKKMRMRKIKKVAGWRAPH